MNRFFILFFVALCSPISPECKIPQILNRTSALDFLNQKKVSKCDESIKTAAEVAFPPLKNETILGYLNNSNEARKHPQVIKLLLQRFLELYYKTGDTVYLRQYGVLHSEYAISRPDVELVIAHVDCEKTIHDLSFEMAGEVEDLVWIGDNCAVSRHTWSDLLPFEKMHDFAVYSKYLQGFKHSKRCSKSLFETFS